MTNNAMHPVGSSEAGKSLNFFGTDGIRGPIKSVLTPAIAFEVGYWSGLVLRKKSPLLIGMDSRNSSEILSLAVSAGLTKSGHEVWDIGYIFP